MKDNIYNINLKIDVDKKYIDADMKLDFYMNNKGDSLNFYIYKDLEIENIKCNKNIVYEVSKEVSNWSPFIKESKLIKINFKEEINKRDKLNVFFKYKGSIGIVSEYEINRISKQWVELGLYSPWFPLFEDFRMCKFNVNVDITDGYKVVNAKRVKDLYVINNENISEDCTIIASNKFKEFKLDLGDMGITVYYLEDIQKDISYKLFSNISEIMSFYSRFGRMDSKDISIINLPRKNGGGYCRENLIVLNLDGEENDVDTFMFIAHELAHLWWHGANTNSFEDWLNESFAEFSALLAVRKVFGEEEFTKKIKLYEEESKEAPAIMNLNREDEKAYECLYRKGPIVLNKLLENVGQEIFNEILMKKYKGNINTTDKLLQLIEKLTTKDIAYDFKGLLI